MVAALGCSVDDGWWGRRSWKVAPFLASDARCSGGHADSWQTGGHDLSLGLHKAVKFRRSPLSAAGCLSLDMKQSQLHLGFHFNHWTTNQFGELGHLFGYHAWSLWIPYDLISSLVFMTTSRSWRREETREVADWREDGEVHWRSRWGGAKGCVFCRLCGFIWRRSVLQLYCIYLLIIISLLELQCWWV